MPLFRRGGHFTLKIIGFTLIGEVFERHGLIKTLNQVALGQHQQDGLLLLDQMYLVAPLVHTLERGEVVTGHANHETIRAPVLNLAIYAKMFVSRRVLYFDFDLLFEDIFDAAINVKDGRLVIVLIEHVEQVVGNHA